MPENFKDDNQVIPPSAVSTPALVATTILAVVALGAVVAVQLFVPDGSPTLVAGLMSLIVLLATGIVAILKQGQEAHKNLNSRLTLLIEKTNALATVRATLAEKDAQAGRNADAQLAANAALAASVASVLPPPLPPIIQIPMIQPLPQTTSDGVPIVPTTPGAKEGKE